MWVELLCFAQGRALTIAWWQLVVSHPERPRFVGATGFDRVGLRWAAGRGLLATLNRGTVKRIDNTYSEGLALAA